MGRPVHFEIHAENPERAVKFYANVFGWTFNQWPGMADYWTIQTGPKSEPGIDDGLMRRRGPAPADGAPVNAFVCAVTVPDVDKAVKSVAANKGTLAVPKSAVGGVGWVAYCKDTEGNLIGLWQDDPKAR